ANCGSRDTVKSFHFLRRKTGERADCEQPLRGRQRRKTLACEVEYPAMGLAQLASHLRHLALGAAGADDRPCRCLVGRVEEGRAQARRHCLEPPNDRVPPADLEERLTVEVE